MTIKLTDAVTVDRRRRPRVGLILALLAVIVVIVVAIAISQQQDKPLAELRIRDQQVSVKTQADFVPGVEGQALEAGNEVRTDDEGQAQVDFFDGSLTRLDASTTFVVKKLEDGPQGRRISLELDAGRTWNRVERLTSSEDRYEVSGGNAVATVRGTTFIADGRQAPIWYYIGQEGETEASAPPDLKFVLGRNDCVRVDEDGMRECTDHEFHALIDDWVRENQGLDALAAATSPTPSPTPTPTATAAGPSRRVRPASTSTPVPDETRRPRVQNTEDPNEDDKQPTDDPPTDDPPTDDPPTDDPPEEDSESTPPPES